MVDDLIYNVYHTIVKYFDWDEDKNDWLIANRGISFQLIKELIESGFTIAVIENHAPYVHQKVYMVKVVDYIYEVPVFEDEEKIVLITAFPSREATKRYLLEE